MADALKKANSEKAKAAADALKKENAEKAKAAAEALKKAKEDAARIEAERIAKEKSDRKKTEKEEAKRKAREEAERKAREEAERKAREEAERKAREESERKAKEEAEKKAREEAERKAREEAERKAKEEAERKAREEAERKAREEALIAEKEHSVTQTNKSNTKTSTQLEITPRNDYNIMREANKTNELFPLLTNRHINLLLNPKIENSFNSITSNYLSHYNILHISQYLHPEHKNLLKKIHRIEAIILVLVGILNERLENFKIVLKGSKGLQMEFSRIKWRTTVTTDDIDLLIMPVGNYNKADVENIANKLSGLIDALINQIYPSVKEYGIVSEGISVLPKFIAKNPNIVKMSYFFNKKSFAILDIDFKEDTERFFTEEKTINTHFLLEQTDLLYHHQTLDSFIEEKKTIKKKYTDCKCPSDVSPSAVPPSAVPPSAECEPLCKEKQYILDKFQKYEPIIEEYENRKNQTQKTAMKPNTNKSQNKRSNQTPK